MATRNYTIRDGFVVILKLTKADGSTYERRSESGETVSLTDEQAAQHLHKLEFADQADRDAAIAAEQKAAVMNHAAGSPVELVQTLVAALQHALGGAAPAEVQPA
jgi:hypothetical protein